VIEVQSRGVYIAKCPNKEKKADKKDVKKEPKKLKFNSTIKENSDDSDDEISNKSDSEYYCFFSQPIFMRKGVPDPSLKSKCKTRKNLGQGNHGNERYRSHEFIYQNGFRTEEKVTYM
jgi:hypothetical protein